MATQTPAPPTSDPAVISRLAAKRDKWKAEATRVQAEHAKAADELARLRKELEDLRAAQGPREVEDLKGQLRTLRHRHVFDRLAKERGASDDVLDDLFALSGYKADKDDADEEAIAKLLDEAAGHPSRSRFFAAWDDDGDDDRAEAGETEAAPPPPARREPPVDAGRGGRHKGDGTVYLTRDQLADPRFMLDPRNAELKKNAKIRA